MGENTAENYDDDDDDDDNDDDDEEKENTLFQIIIAVIFFFIIFFFFPQQRITFQATKARFCHVLRCSRIDTSSPLRVCGSRATDKR